MAEIALRRVQPFVSFTACLASITYTEHLGGKALRLLAVFAEDEFKKSKVDP
jgi:hypothetical protein